ncbi:hypothetical protein G6F56_008991 [Rhizopus delemar]|nr:hypothetical protein G6F56_008991 [Rhizopus delemar]
MLNPFAGEFKPITIEPNLPKKKEKQKEKRRPSRKTSTGDGKAHSPNNTAKNTKKTVDNGPPPTTKKNSRSNSNIKNREEGSSKRRTSRHEIAAAVNLEDQFKQEAKFIAIEAAIDPIHRINNTTGISTGKQLEHGYERYIGWINRSLEMYDMITVVGMENAIADVVSIITIVQDREIGVHEEVETFTTIRENGRKASGIQVRLRSYF